MYFSTRIPCSEVKISFHCHNCKEYKSLPRYTIQAYITLDLKQGGTDATNKTLHEIKLSMLHHNIIHKDNINHQLHHHQHNRRRLHVALAVP